MKKKILSSIKHKERLERLIAKQREKKITDANEFIKLQTLLEELLAEEEKSKALGFNVRVQFAIFGILEKILKDFESAKKLTFDIYHALEPLKVIDWRQKENILKKMRVAVKDALSKNNINKDVNQIAGTIVDLLKVHPD